VTAGRVSRWKRAKHKMSESGKSKRNSQHHRCLHQSFFGNGKASRHKIAVDCCQSIFADADVGVIKLEIMTDLSSDLAIPEAARPRFFLARQPILNRDQELIGYELLFRSAAVGPANVSDDVSATAAVIAHASELGLNNVIGNFLGFINVDATVLMSDFIHFLPADKSFWKFWKRCGSRPSWSSA